MPASGASSLPGPPRTVVFLLGPLVGVSGGDVHALRLVDHLHAEAPGSVTVLAPAAVRAQLPSRSRTALQPAPGPLDDRVLAMPLYVLNVSLRMLRALVRAPRADVVVAASHFFQDVIPCFVRARRHGSKVVAYVYHLVEEERKPAGLRSRVSIWLERFSVGLLRRARALVFVDNPATAAALVARGFPAGDVRTTANAYDPWEPLPPAAPAGGEPSLLTVGRLTEEKGVWDALEVARRLPEARVVLLGDGPLREPARKRAAAEGLRNVELPGFLDDAAKWRALRSATAYLAPSREEGWGIAVGEALTAGLPVAAYDLPAYAHFGPRLRVVPTGDAGALAEAARALLAEAARGQPAGGAASAAHGLPAGGAASQGADDLPLWHDVLAAEREAIARRVPERAPAP